MHDFQGTLEVQSRSRAQKYLCMPVLDNLPNDDRTEHKKHEGVEAVQRSHWYTRRRNFIDVHGPYNTYEDDDEYVDPSQSLLFS
jgi:hypothetical protein